MALIKKRGSKATRLKNNVKIEHNVRVEYKFNKE
jgi:hypothetical protein